MYLNKQNENPPFCTCLWQGKSSIQRHQINTSSIILARTAGRARTFLMFLTFLTFLGFLHPSPYVTISLWDDTFLAASGHGRPKRSYNPQHFTRWTNTTTSRIPDENSPRFHHEQNFSYFPRLNPLVRHLGIINRKTHKQRVNTLHSTMCSHILRLP